MKAKIPSLILSTEESHPNVSDDEPGGDEKKTKAKSQKKAPVYKKGDKVVYPMHGVGVIEEIKDVKILGEKKKVYVINIINNGMTVMIPVQNVDKVGIRSVIKESEVQKVGKVLADEETEMEEDWKLRYQINMEKIKTGSIYEVAEVARNLYRRSLDKDLSIMERKLYENAYQLITNEIALAKDIEVEDAGNLISELLS